MTFSNYELNWRPLIKLRNENSPSPVVKRELSTSFGKDFADYYFVAVEKLFLIFYFNRVMTNHRRSKAIHEVGFMERENCEDIWEIIASSNASIPSSPLISWWTGGATHRTVQDRVRKKWITLVDGSWIISPISCRQATTRTSQLTSTTGRKWDSSRTR